MREGTRKNSNFRFAMEMKRREKKHEILFYVLLNAVCYLCASGAVVALHSLRAIIFFVAAVVVVHFLDFFLQLLISTRSNFDRLSCSVCACHSTACAQFE